MAGYIIQVHDPPLPVAGGRCEVSGPLPGSATQATPPRPGNREAPRRLASAASPGFPYEHV